MYEKMIPGDFKGSREQALQLLERISFEHVASTPYDDDEHWFAVSPFDLKRYHFAASIGCNPCFIEAE